ncbi:MAG TPA: RNA methyltransferase [Vicinamibacterales bacterium]|nr:RNA methyltransferase [Vicinamibacterales bacterium]
MARSIERIAGASDPRVAAYRDVRDPELVRSRGLFVAEGRFVVRRAIEDRRCAIQSLLVNDAALRDLGPLVDAIDPGAPVYVCDAHEFPGIAGFDVHRGCLALVARPRALSIAEALAGVATAIVLEGVTNPDNVGGVFRNASAFGAGAVILSPTCCDPLYRKAIRTSMGAALRVPFARADEWPSAVAAIRERGFTVAALTPREPSESIREWQVGRVGPVAEAGQARIALLVGTEGAGLTEESEAAADVRIRIPISDAVDSLNLAVAVGIALFALVTSDPTGDL